MINFGALLPHPPIIVAGVGQPEDLTLVAETIQSFHEVDSLLAADPPDCLVVFTPHGTVYQDAIVVYADPRLEGSLERFGLARSWAWETDLALAEEVIEQGNQAGLPVYLMDQATASRQHYSESLDHGVLVPLSFFSPSWAERVKLVVIPLSFLPLEELYHFGAVIQQAVRKLDRKVAVIASGDLSHCLQPGAPAGYDSRGQEFDQKLIELLQQQPPAVEELFNLDPVLLEKAAECGFRSLIMLLGCFDQQTLTSRVHSYQGPFGVGYAVVSFQPSGTRSSLTTELLARRHQRFNLKRDQESPLVRYARQTVEAYALDQPLPNAAAETKPWAKQRAGVFVSIKKHGQLRGCIGTTEPTQPTLLQEITQNAISAANRDPRFSPVQAAELPVLTYSVDILQPAEPITGLEQLDPDRYGVIVSSGLRKGLLLPKLEGIETAAEQVAIARRKAGIGPDEPVKLERFEVVRHL